MSRFQLPKYLSDYLNTRLDAPTQSWVDFTHYYSQLNPYFIDYLNRTVKPCVALATASRDQLHRHLSMGIGYAIKKAAVQLIKGDSLIFNGDDKATAFLSDIWARKSHFERLIEVAVDNTVIGGTSALKTDVNAYGRVSLSSYRVDRFYATTDCFGEVCECILLANLLTSQKSTDGVGAYWLVEHRQYKNGEPIVTFKVHTNGGVAGTNVLPIIYGAGLAKKNLPATVLRTVNALGIELNTPMKLPFKEGLGVRLLLNTATNATVPGLVMGDPLLYGAQDLLWSIDTVFCGSVIDVINGEGKILAPSRFINEVSRLLKDNGFKITGQREEAWTNNDDGVTYLMTERDKDFSPTPIQFNIRAQEYSTMYEWYLRQITANAGFTPTSVFPFLADNSVKTATEVNSDDNKTRATVSSWHRLNLPTINDALEEVLYLEGFKGRAALQLTDYIGNKIQRDQDLRENYAAGAIPQDVFVQKINGITDAETNEYIAKINAERKEKEASAFGAIAGFGNDE